MPNDPGQELSQVDFGNLIGGPLCAVIDAQTDAARATAEFIRSVGFDKDNKPVYVEFKYPKEISPYQPGAPAVIAVNNGGSGYKKVPTVTVKGTDGKMMVGVKATAVLTNETVTSIICVSDVTADLTQAGTVEITKADGDSGNGASADWKPAKYRPAEYQDMKLEVPFLTMIPIPFIRIEEATVDFNAKITSMERRSEVAQEDQGRSESGVKWGGRKVARMNASCSYQKKTTSSSSVQRTYSMQVHVRATQDEMPAGLEKVLSLLEGAMKSTPVLPPK